MGKGYVSDQMNAARILTKGKITDLSSGFKLLNGVPFSVFIIPKNSALVEPVIVSVKLYQEDDFSDCPFALRGWNEPAISEIEASGIDLALYDVYWGAGKI